MKTYIVSLIAAATAVACVLIHEHYENKRNIVLAHGIEWSGR